MKQKIFVIIIVAVLLAMTVPMLTAAPGEAAGPQFQYGYTTYIVRHGDTLASIGRRFCTSWQEIYALNQAIIGPDPSHLVAGMALTVPNRCGGGGGCANVWDRGWLPHAQGYIIPPNRYWVIRGDTWYSIGKRFGVSVSALRRANGQYYPYAYTAVIIPCLNVYPMPPQPPFYPTPMPPTPTPAPSPAAISITSPPANAVLPATFVVSGVGKGLHEGNVVVRVKDQNGAVIAERAVVLQGPHVGVGGEGTWSAQFSVNEPAGSPGVIEAFSPETGAHASVHIFFGDSANEDYQPGQCQIHVRAGAAAYKQPEGEVLGIFPNPATLNAERRERVNNVDWYRTSVTIDNVLTPLWTPASSLDGHSPGC